MKAAPDATLHPSVVAPLPTIEGGFQSIVADPPWKFKAWSAEDPDAPKGRAVERHYRTMRLQEIIDMPVRDVVAPDAHLWLWITGPFLVAGAHIPLMESWGFKPSAIGFTWMKLKRSTGGRQLQMISLSELPRFLHIAMGYTTRKNCEFCILGRRGRAKRLSKKVVEPIITPVREHSRKPDEAYDRILEYGPGPYLELFSREDREGFVTWGNETGKLNGRSE